MRVEVLSPCCLHLGFVRGPDGSACELVIALQHPPIQLMAQPAQQLFVSGARVGVAHRAAENYFARAGRAPHGQIEIELAIPAFMGLGADEMLYVSVAHALQRISGTAALPLARSAFHLAFERGGLLLVDEHGELLRRAAIAHVDEADDWVFVLVLPQTPDDVVDDFEMRCHATLRDASAYLDPFCTADALFDAATRDDFGAFCIALAAIHAANQAALIAGGYVAELNDQERDVIARMRAGGARFAGRALAGLGLIGLIQGGPASRVLRRSLVQHLGYFGPRVMATICDNYGAKIKMVS